LCFFL
jgi:ryanodine receptor 2